MDSTEIAIAHECSDCEEKSNLQKCVSCGDLFCESCLTPQTVGILVIDYCICHFCFEGLPELIEEEQTND